MTTRSVHLGAFLYPTGHHIAAWRHPGSQADAGVDFRHYVRLAQAAGPRNSISCFLPTAWARAATTSSS